MAHITRLHRVATAVALALAVCAAPAHALQGRDDSRDSRADKRNERSITRDDAAERARRATGGRVLSIQEGSRNDNGYRVKILTPDGQVRYYDVERNGRSRR